jgi:hypothetical protein
MPAFLPKKLTTEQRSNVALIRKVFPTSVENAPLRVAYCESKPSLFRGARTGTGRLTSASFSSTMGARSQTSAELSRTR